MTEFKEILLSSLNGIQLGIAKKADSDGNEKLTGSEISIFLVDCEDAGVTYGKENTPSFWEYWRDKLFTNTPSLFQKKYIDKKTYGDYKVVTLDEPLTGKKVKIYDNTSGDRGDAKVETAITTDEYGNVIVNYERVQEGRNDITGELLLLTQKTSFTYNIKDLENHIINDGVDKYGNKLTRFKEIPTIRSLPENERTEEQKDLLEEFDNLIKYITEAGTEYGVDPKCILSLIQEEVCFDGLGKERKVTGTSGKGYMQLTTRAIGDMLNCTSYDGKIKNAEFGKGLKLDRYGAEIVELFKSRGFEIEEAMTTEQKRNLLRAVMNYLKENKDPEFNIKLGTIKLRQNLNDANGDFKKAAQNYNANETIEKATGLPTEVAYANRTYKYSQQLAQNCPNDSTYTYKKTKIV